MNYNLINVFLFLEAESLGMPLIPPYEGVKTNGMLEKGQGVNFAVAGATALDSAFHEAQGVINPYTNASLGVQLEWFKDSLPSICGTPSGSQVQPKLTNKLFQTT